MKKLTRAQFLEQFCTRKADSSFDPDVLQSVSAILNDVRMEGDQAVRKYTDQFDRTTTEQLLVSDAEKLEAKSRVTPETLAALQDAAANIRAFHEKQITPSRIMAAEDGKQLGQLVLPMERIGIYVPGGKAVYPSTILMNSIPARLAGVQEITMVTPVKDNSGIAPVLVAAAEIAGVDKVYKIGGAQAIGALAYGTESINPVDKIVGPGNTYVAAAKMLVFGQVGIDMIAGPSEVAIIADETADPAFIAADLLAQAEHDEKARVVLLTDSETLIQSVETELATQLEKLPRKAIASQAINGSSALVLTESVAESFELSNAFAPEHLEIQTADPLSTLGKIKHAGSVFLGSYAPTALGDYYGGTNHVLPTNGTARFSSGLSVDDFIKKTTYTYYDKQALKRSRTAITRLTEEEQLTGHGESINIRFK
ncbi:histidinol dehydrogenase [Terribacillus halophilus]|uniref:Histidinol dehydrogenase n=1 Tax=Terribacillus halophilus TaxID=361279 RepID=A0A1G6MQW0_9BACI|nr:histidinol dehydrogenase [Terribacillus halophilus]SDC57614.1 histidinol dehydrogenase [Terribacillus halophilus]